MTSNTIQEEIHDPDTAFHAAIGFKRYSKYTNRNLVKMSHSLDSMKKKMTGQSSIGSVGSNIIRHQKSFLDTHKSNLQGKIDSVDSKNANKR